MLKATKTFCELQRRKERKVSSTPTLWFIRGRRRGTRTSTYSCHQSQSECFPPQTFERQAEFPLDIGTTGQIRQNASCSSSWLVSSHSPWTWPIEHTQHGRDRPRCSCDPNSRCQKDRLGPHICEGLPIRCAFECLRSWIVLRSFGLRSLGLEGYGQGP